MKGFAKEGAGDPLACGGGNCFTLASNKKIGTCSSTEQSPLQWGDAQTPQRKTPSLAAGVHRRGMVIHLPPPLLTSSFPNPLFNPSSWTLPCQAISKPRKTHVGTEGGSGHVFQDLQTIGHQGSVEGEGWSCLLHHHYLQTLLKYTRGLLCKTPPREPLGSEGA